MPSKLTSFDVKCTALPFDVLRDPEGTPLGPDHFLTLGNTYHVTRVNIEGETHWYLVVRDDGKLGSYAAHHFERILP